MYKVGRGYSKKIQSIALKTGWLNTGNYAIAKRRTTMKTSKVLKGIALILAFCLMFTCFVGCGEKQTAESSAQLATSTDTTSENGTEDISSVEAGTEDSSMQENASQGDTSEGTASKDGTTSKTTTSSKSSNTTSSKPSANTSNTSSKPSSGTSSKTEVEKEEPVDEFDLVDFMIEVQAGKEPVVLQLTDTQIIDAAQERHYLRLNDSQDKLYATDKMEDNLFKYIEETINAAKPDLIIITGDLVYGEFDDKGTSMQALIKEMDSYKIPWAPIYGNHEGETKKGIDWYGEQLEASKYCLIKQTRTHDGKKISGNGNYTVGIKQGGVLTRVFFMLDSNGCSKLSTASQANGTATKNSGVQEDQQKWAYDTMSKIASLSKNTKFSLAFHIPNKATENAYSKYPANCNISTASNKGPDDFGFMANKMSLTWDTSNTFFNKVKGLGVDSLFMGHYHGTNATVKSEGIYYVFGQKTGIYDSYVAKSSNGTLALNGSGTPQVGGTVITLKSDGNIKGIYNYICGEK